MFREMVSHFAATKAAFVFFLGVALLPGIAAGVASIGYLQQNYFPITDRFDLDQASYDVHGDIVLSGTFYKLYPDWVCEYDGMNWYMPVMDESGGEIRFRVKSVYGDTREKASNNNRHEGLNFFRDWIIGVSEYPDMRNLTGHAYHTCLGFIKARTKFPVIDLPIRYVRPS